MKLKYFLPWWPSDYIWKEWAPDDDLDRKLDWTKTYFWDYAPNVLDGILVSRMAVSPRRVGTLREEIRYDGLIMGDSGAHSYRKDDGPPYSCRDLLEYYAEGKFDYGMTLDLVAAPWVRKGGLPEKELRRRLCRTIENAERCVELHSQYEYPYELIGVVQGWSPESYRRCARALLSLGFSYLAVAGQRNIKLLKDSVAAILDEVEQVSWQVKMHVLGSGDPRLIPFYRRKEIDSFDSATWLRKAWLDNRKNYFMVDEKGYKAFRATRVPVEVGLNTTSLEFTTQIYCDCPWCRSIEQEILIFRGHERNMRRGFHNVHQYAGMLH
jgi:hypothetical protein